MPKPYTPNDKLMYKAKREGYRARSVYKLQQLDQKYHLLRHGMKVLDVGAAPGSWLQYISERIGERGIAIGLDLQSINPVAPNVHTFIQDIYDQESLSQNLESLQIEQFDLILSDIAPNTTGIPGVDQNRSTELSQAVVEIAKIHLKPTKHMIMKVFQGQDFPRFLKSLYPLFREVKAIKVDASRDRSKEIYVCCFGKR